MPQLLSPHARDHESQLLKPVHTRVCMGQLLSWRAATTELCVPRNCVLQQETPMHHNEKPPLSPQLEKTHVQQQRYCTNNNKNK